ncbi:MAG: hypothetical protein JXA52_09805, partial [Planctomycetes bacterium]|nr:hypothetical protein [Planctomycetota bacterium]
MTPRERVEAVLTGKMADQIPFTSYPNEIPDQPCRDRLLANGLCLVERVRPFTEHSPDTKKIV